jgi:hypothetical protein
MRRMIETVVDLNAAVLGKLGKVDGTAEELVVMIMRLESRIQAIESEWVVYPLESGYADLGSS